MKRCLFFAAFMLAFSAPAYATSTISSQLGANCPDSPYVGNCSGCHSNVQSEALSAYQSGDWSFFCSQTDPADVDDDGDGFTENQGDCNDNNAAINPAAAEICSDGVDNNCDGLTDGQDINACPAPPTPTCVDADMDGYNAATPGLDCGVIDCNDNNPAINPGAAERCSDGVDNNCDGLTDGQDTGACPAPPTCTDADQDGFFAEAGCNTVQDCNDSDAMIFPGAAELCGDSLDNDCDGNVDEGCSMGGNEDGATLYEMNCASCHNMLSSSEVCGEDAEDIMDAISENEGGMSSLSGLTDDQIRSIAEAMAASCSQNGGNDESDDDRGYTRPSRSDNDDDRGYTRPRRSDDDERDRRNNRRSSDDDRRRSSRGDRD